MLFSSLLRLIDLYNTYKLSTFSVIKDPKPSFVSKYLPLVHTWCRKLSKQTEVSKIRQHSLALEEQGKKRKERNMKGTQTRHQSIWISKREAAVAPATPRHIWTYDIPYFKKYLNSGWNSGLKLEALTKYRPIWQL